jgi:hypothetical protein
MTTQPEQFTPIEDRGHREIHNAAFNAVVKAGGHWECATECGFLAVEAFTGEPGRFRAQPCERCMEKWQQSKERMVHT